MVMSIRVSDCPFSALFSYFSPTCFYILNWNFACDFVLMYFRSSSSIVMLRQFLYVRFRRDVLWYGDVCPGLHLSDSPTVRVSVHPFSAHFSYMLWRIEVKFCTWLCFDVLQSKFECHYFASIFEGVMPLFELRIWEMCSFLHFSLTCFDILSWNFVYDFVLIYYKSSLSHFSSILKELCLFLNFE